MTKTMDRIQKNDMLPALYKACLDFKLTRTDLIIALGGGVIGEFKEEFKKRVKDQAKMLYRKTLDEVSDRHKFVCVAYAVKDIVIDQWIATQKAYDEADGRTVYYLSMEFLMGRALGNMIINLSARDEIKESIEELGLDLNVIEDQEPESDTNTVCSSRRLKMDIRKKFLKIG